MGEKIKLLELDIDIESLSKHSGDAQNRVNELTQKPKEQKVILKQLNAQIKAQTKAMAGQKKPPILNPQIQHPI